MTTTLTTPFTGVPQNPCSLEEGTFLKINNKINNRNFLRKIYGILLYQLIITVFMCYFAMYNGTIQNYVLKNSAPLVAGTILSFVFLFMLFCYQDSYPYNMWILTAFTISISYTIATTCASYVSLGYKTLVIKSFLITILTFVILTTFTFQSKYDFGFMEELVVGGISVLIFWGILNWIMGTDGGIGYSLLGIFIFVCAIIYDTHRLKDKFGYDDYIIASVNLYLDILNLFIYILDFMKKMND